MVGIVLVGHNPFATALLDAASMIFGTQAHVYAKNLNHDTNLDVYTAEVRMMIETANQGQGVLVLADLMGGSPGNAASYSIREGVAVVTGANLPMLLEVLAHGHECLENLVSTARGAGASGIICVNDLLNNGN
jgi:PTS system mannose-specific IIA component